MDKYLSFSGLATRSQYWAVQIIAYVIFFIIAFVAVGVSAIGTGGIFAAVTMLLISGVLMSWAVLATTVRRCRDAGINPWFTLTLFIPYLALIPWVVFGCLSTQKEKPNESNGLRCNR